MDLKLPVTILMFVYHNVLRRVLLLLLPLGQQQEKQLITITEDLPHLLLDGVDRHLVPRHGVVM